MTSSAFGTTSRLSLRCLAPSRGRESAAGGRPTGEKPSLPCRETGPFLKTQHTAVVACVCVCGRNEQRRRRCGIVADVAALTQVPFFAQAYTLLSVHLICLFTCTPPRHNCLDRPTTQGHPRPGGRADTDPTRPRALLLSLEGLRRRFLSRTSRPRDGGRLAVAHRWNTPPRKTGWA